MWGCPYGVVFGCLISSGRKIFRPGGNCDFKLLFHVERLGMDLNKGRPRGDAHTGVAWEYFLDFYMGRNVFRPDI